MSLISYQCKPINYSNDQIICGLEENTVIRIEGTYLVALWPHEPGSSLVSLSCRAREKPIRICKKISDAKSVQCDGEGNWIGRHVDSILAGIPALVLTNHLCRATVGACRIHLNKQTGGKYQHIQNTTCRKNPEPTSRNSNMSYMMVKCAMIVRSSY
jgi:hypothetical protein